MVVITGATGHYGRKVTDILLKKLPASQVGVSVREPEKAMELTQKGVRVAKGDFAHPATLAAAFDGAEQVLLVSVNLLGEEALLRHGNAIRAAKKAGVRRVLYTSHQAASPDSEVAFSRDHAATEALLAASGMSFVSLRNGFYAESCLQLMGAVRETERLALPADGPVSWTLRDDLAEAAAAALTDGGLFDGITPPMTASETYTFADIAKLASEMTGRDIVREVIAEETYRASAIKRGYPEAVVSMLMPVFHAMRNGEFKVVDSTLGRVLGRRPIDLRAILQPFLAEPKLTEADNAVA